MANYETIQLEKGMYQAKNGFTAALESLDHSENYRGTPLEGLDAYQRQLKRFDIHVSGRGSDRVEKFFQTGSSAALFPEYVCRAVRQGIEQENVLPQIVATVTQIEGPRLPHDYEHAERGREGVKARRRGRRNPADGRAHAGSFGETAQTRPHARRELCRQSASKSSTCLRSRCGRSARTSRARRWRTPSRCCCTATTGRTRPGKCLLPRAGR